MIIRSDNMTDQVRSRMRGGDGDVTLHHLVDCKDQKHIRLLCEMTLPPGASIGDHVHEHETEYYIITQGKGVVLDSGEDHEVAQGDVIVTGDGASHRIRNAGDAPLKVMAIIVTYNA